MTKLTQQTEVESFRVLGKAHPAKHQGLPVAINFDYGIITHPIYGPGHLKGHSLCFEPFLDIRSLPPTEAEKTLGPKATMELVMTVAAGLEKFGFEVDFGDPTMNVISEHMSLEAITVYSRLYANAPRENFKIVGAMNLLLYFIEETFVAWNAEEKDLRTLVDIYTAALDGHVTHLSQIPSLPENLRAPVAAAMFLRYECSKFPGWIHYHKEIVRCIESFHNEIMAPPGDDLAAYVTHRTYSVTTPMLMECYWLYLGLEIPTNVRLNPAYIHYVHALSRQQTFANDISSLLKEMNDGEPMNSILILAKSMPFQEAIDTAVRLLEEQFFQAKEAGRVLMKAFPGDKFVEQMVSTCGRATDLMIPLHEELDYRYGLTDRCTYDLIEFNEVYQQKEKQVHEAPVRNPDKTTAKIFAEIEKAKEINQKINQVTETFVSKTELTEPLPEPKVVEKEDITTAEPKILEIPVDPEKQLVKHMGLIPDGNRRWARGQGIPTMRGHWAGADAVEKIVREAFRLGVHTVTLWVLSASNFKRPKAELDNLREVVKFYFEHFKHIADEYSARITHVGKKERITEDMMECINEIERLTAGRVAHQINIAIDYDGREEIVYAVDRLASTSSLTSRPPSPDQITQNLWGNDQPFPEPDLIVRTGSKDSGTYRTSGFMIWQAANTEFYFENKYLPEVEENDVKKWFQAYATAEKRLGL